MTNKTKKSKRKPKIQDVNFTDFEKWLNQEVIRTGKTKEQIIEETFKDGFLVWTVGDMENVVGKKIQESATSGGTIIQSPPMLTAWAMPKEVEDLDVYRRLRKNFAPVSRAIDYIKAQILGKAINVSVADDEDNHQHEMKEEIERFCRWVYQDRYTASLYTILSIMVDEALTVGAAGAEIRYIAPINFWDYVQQQGTSSLPIVKSTVASREHVYFKSREPDWQSLGGIVQLKIFKNAQGRMKLYRDPETWEANYWTLDEIVSQGDTAMAVHQLTLKKDTGQAVKFHPWQIFWLALNRREFDERGTSVIEPVRYTVLLLEKILDAVGEGAYRAGNKKYFIITGTEKRPWGKVHIRNVMEQIVEMGRKNWTAVPVPYGFDIKEIGGQVFEANNIITHLLNMVAQGMHVPVEILGVPRRLSPEATTEEFAISSLELDRLSYELKIAVENQLFRTHLWCKFGKMRQKQGGKTEPIFIPFLKIPAKGLTSDTERLRQIVQLLNVANPVTPELKLELEREMTQILGYDSIKLKSQEQLRKDLAEIEEQMKEKKAKKTEEKDEEDTEKISLLEKKQGEPKPQSVERQEKRLEGGVNVPKRGQARPMGSTRIPKESQVMVGETWNRENEDQEHKAQRVKFIRESKKTGEVLTHEQIDKIFSIQEAIYNAYGYGEERVPVDDRVAQRHVPSTGQEIQTPKGIKTLVNLLNNKIVIVVKTPLTGGIAGYNKDGTRIYFDSDVPEWMYIPLLAHETFEQALVEILGFSYEWAHVQATKLEKELCEKMGISWKQYDTEYKRLLELQKKRSPQPKNPEDMAINGKGTGEPYTTEEHPAVNSHPFGRYDLTQENSP